MSNDSVPIISTSRKSTLGDRIRSVADQLRQENQVQVKATARILGAAAKIAENHDQLIDEVAEMVEEDLDQQAHNQHPEIKPALYTVEQLQKQFKTLKEAKAHFNLKANGWEALVSKLNEQETSSRPQASKPRNSVDQRLEAIERELQTMRGDINQIMNLVTQMAEKLL
jgi:chromosome segregation ATPase